MLCLVAALHELSYPSKHGAGQLGLSLGFRGSAWVGLLTNALPASALEALAVQLPLCAVWCPLPVLAWRY